MAKITIPKDFREFLNLLIEIQHGARKDLDDIEQLTNVK